MTGMDAYNKDIPDTFSYTGISSNISLLFTIYCIITGILILHFRNWEPEILKQCLGIMAYPIFLFGSVAIAIRYNETNKYILPISLLAFMLFPLIVSLIGAWVFAPLLIFGISFSVWSCWLNRSALSSRDLIKLLLASIFLPVFYFLVINGSSYADIYSDLKGIQGDLHVDTLFHSAIINMLARFGVSSIGLDGLIPVNYHIGVHRWVAANLLVLGGETPILLSIVKQVALIPAFFFTVIHVVTRLSDRSSSFVSTLGFTFAILWLTDSRVWNSYLVSESYIFSLSIFVAMLPVGKSWIAQTFKSKLLDVVQPWEIAITLLVIAACWIAKVSTGIILGVYLIACVLSPKLLVNHRHIIIITFALIVLSILGLWAINQFYFGIAFSFSFFNFAKTYSTEFIWEIIVFCISISVFYIFKPKDIKQKGEQKLHNSIAFTLLVTFLAGEIPGILFELGGGGAYYFSHPALLIAIIYGTSVLYNYLPFQLLKEPIISDDDHKLKILLRFKLMKKFQSYFGYVILALSLVIVLTTSADLKSYKKYVRNFIKLVRENDNYFSFSDKFSTNQVLHELILPPKINKDILLSQTAIGRIKNSIANLGINKSEKSFAIYISPNYHKFWTSRRRCWEPPLTVPALIGLPLLNGVRSGLGDCEPIQYYGMKDYGKSSLNYELDPTDICKKAKKFGFEKVYEITWTKNQMHSCNIN